MKSKKNLVLLGMMASGKSTLGNLISKKLNKKFIDIDKIIEKNLNMTVAQIFEKEGEEFFRKEEEKVTLKYLTTTNSLIALGGGSFLNNKIREEVTKNSVSFWLKWKTSVLLNRIKNNKKRPLTVGVSDDALIKLARIRSSIYSKALYEVKCDNLSKNQIKSKIADSFINLDISMGSIVYSFNQLNAAKETLEISLKRLEAGLTTQREIVNIQADLSESESNYINSILDYKITLAELERATLLEKQSICNLISNSILPLLNKINKDGI